MSEILAWDILILKKVSCSSEIEVSLDIFFFFSLKFTFYSVLVCLSGASCYEELSGGGALPDIRDCTALQIKCLVSMISSLGLGLEA